MLTSSSLAVARDRLLPFVRSVLIPGVTTAIVAFPLSIGLAITAGVPPENMVLASIYAAFFNALFAASRYGVPGPNTAVALITGAAVAPYAPPESGIYLGYVFALCVMVGVLQLLIAVLLRYSDIMDYISKTVIDGLTMGIGAIFILSSLNLALGLAPDFGNQWIVFNAFVSIVAAFEGVANPFAMATAAITLLVGLFCNGRPRLRSYAIVFAVLAGTVVGNAFDSLTHTRLEHVGHIALPLFSTSLPDFRQVSWSTLFHFAGPALAIAVMGALQSLSIAKGLRDSGDRYAPVPEALSQGLQHIFLGFFHGGPVSNSFNKSVLLKQLGGNKSAPIVGALFTAALVGWGASFVAMIPMPALSASLILVGLAMIDPRKHKEHFRAGGLRARLLVVTAGATIVLSIENALALGVMISIATHFIQFSKTRFTLHESSQQLTVKLHGPWFYVPAAKMSRDINRALAKRAASDYDCVTIDLTEASIFAHDVIDTEWMHSLAARSKHLVVVPNPKALEDP